MARKAADMTLALIDGEPPEQLYVTEPAQLIIRSSTGPVPQHN